MAHNFLGVLVSFSVRIVTYLTQAWFLVPAVVSYSNFIYIKKVKPGSHTDRSHFLVSARTYSISRFIHIQTFCVYKQNALRFLWHGAYHVVVRGGSHFCQSPKSGGSGVF